MLIDCDTCTARGAGCDDCVVTVLLGAPPARAGGPVVVPLTAAPRLAGTLPSAVQAAAPAASGVVELDEVEQRAVGALAAAGLVPPLRHEPRRPERPGRDQGPDQGRDQGRGPRREPGRRTG